MFEEKPQPIPTLWCGCWHRLHAEENSWFCPLEAPMGATSSTCFFLQEVWRSSFKGLASGRLKSEPTFRRAHCVPELAISSWKSKTSMCGRMARSLRTLNVSWWVVTPLWHIAGRQAEDASCFDALLQIGGVIHFSLALYVTFAIPSGTFWASFCWSILALSSPSA